MTSGNFLSMEEHIKIVASQNLDAIGKYPRNCTTQFVDKKKIMAVCCIAQLPQNYSIAYTEIK